MVFGPGQWTDEAVVIAARAEAQHSFGAPTSISGSFYSWELTEQMLPEALEFAFADDDRPKQPVGPTSLYVSYSFDWRAMPNFPSNARNDYVSRGNSLGVSLGGRRVFIQPTFQFNASDEDPEFRAKLRELETTMPFKPKSTYYYRMEAKKTGKGQKLVKLSAGWSSVA